MTRSIKPVAASIGGVEIVVTPAARRKVRRTARAAAVAGGYAAGIAAEELFGELMYLKRCWSCGDVFQTQNPCGRICPACREAREEKPAKRVRPAARQSIQEIAAAAREAGMSYGQYVAGMEKGKKK